MDRRVRRRLNGEDAIQIWRVIIWIVHRLNRTALCCHVQTQSTPSYKNSSKDRNSIIRSYFFKICDLKITIRDTRSDGCSECVAVTQSFSHCLVNDNRWPEEKQENKKLTKKMLKCWNVIWNQFKNCLVFLPRQQEWPGRARGEASSLMAHWQMMLKYDTN